MDFLPVTLLIVLLVFTSPLNVYQYDDTDFQLPTNFNISIYNSNGNLKHLKFLHTRIPYNVNSTATFQIELLKSMDVNPNPGPTCSTARSTCQTSPQYDISPTSRYTYSASSLVAMNPYRYETNLPKLPTDTWNTIKTLKINRFPINRRTKRGGRRKPWTANKTLLHPP